MKRKILKGTHFPMSIREIQAGYLPRHCFKSIYLYLVQNKFPSFETVVRQVETEKERHLLFDSLLFRIQNVHDEQKPVMGIPESCKDYTFDLYYNSLSSNTISSN